MAASPVARVDDELAARVAALRLVRRAQVGVAGQRAVGRGQHEVAGRGTAAVPYLEQDVLGQRRHAVGAGRGRGEILHTGAQPGGEGSLSDDRVGG